MWCVKQAKWSYESNEKEGDGGFIENDVSEKQKQRIDTKYNNLIIDQLAIKGEQKMILK